MKKLILALCVLLSLVGCSSTATAAPVEENKSNDLLSSFEQDPISFKSLAIDAFSSDASSAPSDEELTTMLDFAMSSSSAHGLTPAHFIVIRDVEEQTKIASGLEAFGMKAPTSEGTVLVLICADTLRDEDVHASDYNGWYSQMYYGLYDAGAANAYLTLAAQTMGYGVHQIAGLNIPCVELGEVNIYAVGGNFGFITRNNWDVDKYMTSKDGKVDFMHTVAQSEMTGGTLEVPAYGNLTLITAMVIGKAKEGVDSVSLATTAYPEDLANYNFWEPEDGESYGKSVEATEKEKATVTVEEGFDLTGVEDGIYTASESSTSSEYTVEVTVESGKITKIEVVDGLENMFAGEDTVKEYIQTIIDTQNVEADVISGATQDCSGISNAVKEALSK